MLEFFHNSFWILCSCFLLSVLLIRLFITQAQKLSLMDNPNHRSLHTIPTARGGGVIFVCITLFMSLFNLFSFSQIEFITLWIATCIMALLGFLDDLYSLTAKKRILIQSLTAIFFSVSYIALDPRAFLYASWMLVLCILISSFLIVWSTNIFNFMDGSDGIAASQAILVFACYLISTSNKDPFFNIAFLSLASLLGFLIWNFPKAKVFMGDCGSGFLGCLIGCLWIHSIWIQNNIFTIGFLIIYSPFIMDTSITLLRRYLAGEAWYSAHRMHAYQRLVHQAHLSHLQLLLLFYGLSAIQFIVFFTWLEFQSWISIVSSFIITILVYIAVEFKAPLSFEKKS